MFSSIKFIPLIILGVGVIVYALPASHSLKPPRDIAAALLLVFGVVTMITGILLTVIPNFFR